MKRARQLREDEIEALVAHYREHRSVVAAAKALDITPQTAGKHLAQAGICTVRRMTDDEIALAHVAHGVGESATSIGRRLGFSTHTIIRVLREEST